MEHHSFSRLSEVSSFNSYNSLRFHYSLRIETGTQRDQRELPGVTQLLGDRQCLVKNHGSLATGTAFLLPQHTLESVYSLGRLRQTAVLAFL